MKYSITFLAAISLAVSSVSVSIPAAAAEFTAGPIKIVNPRSAPTVPGLKVGGVFFESVTISGTKGDTLISASSPVADTVELHRMKMDGDIMRMRQVEKIGLTPDKPVSFERGKADAYHLMLINLKKPLTLNQQFPVTMVFEHAGQVEVTVDVKPHGGGMSHGGHKMMHKHQ